MEPRCDACNVCLWHVSLLLFTFEIFFKLSLSLPFPSSKFSHRPLPALLQILNLFFINCYFMHICICTHILKHNMLLACMLSGLTIYTRQPTGMLFSGEDHPLPLWAACSSVSRVEASWAFPQPVWHVSWCPCLAHVWAVILVRLYRYSFWCY